MSIAREFRDRIAESPNDATAVSKIIVEILLGGTKLSPYGTRNVYAVFSDCSELDINFNEDGTVWRTQLNDSELKQQLKDSRGE